MNIDLISVGKRGPSWATEALAQYCRRMPPELSLKPWLVSAAKVSTSRPLQRRLNDEHKAIKAKLKEGAWLVVLDESGTQFSSTELAKRLEKWQQQRRDLAFVIGGADGLAPELLAAANECWALSRLTLPHAMARVMVAEQLYRAWTILAGHPYHRD